MMPPTNAPPAAAGIDILDPQQEGARPLAREIVRQQRRISMAEVQPPGRARREAGDTCAFHGRSEIGS
jgi:hypothetical protein